MGKPLLRRCSGREVSGRKRELNGAMVGMFVCVNGPGARVRWTGEIVVGVSCVYGPGARVRWHGSILVESVSQT